MTTPFCESHTCTHSDIPHLKGECREARPMEPFFKRAVMVGKVPSWNSSGKEIEADLWLTIRFEDRNGGPELGITGVVGPLRSGDCYGSCGQCRDALDEVVSYAEGYDAETIARLAEIWDTWHLNRMQAGSPAQTAHLETLTFPGYPTNHYDWAKEQLAEAGLQPDPSYIHNDKPYSYGSAWLSIEVPDDVVEWLRALPAGTTKEFPWQH